MARENGRRPSPNRHRRCEPSRTDEFAKVWFRAAPAVDPLRMFFVPWRVERDDWLHVCIRGGILFERCRIAHIAGAPASLEPELREACAEWSSSVIEALRGENRMQTSSAA